MKICFFGTASAIPNQDRFRSSLAVEAASGAFLIPDCGELVSAEIIRRGVMPDQVATLIVTHLHPDHIVGLPLILQHFQLRGRTLPLTVYLPGEGIESVKAFLSTVYLGPEMLKFEVTYAPIQTGVEYQAGDFTFSFLPNNHLIHHAGVRQKAGFDVKGESYSLVFSDGEKKVIYSGDVAKAAELLPLFTPDVDALILEYAHTSAEEALELAAEPAIPPQVILTHIHPRFAADMVSPVPGWVCAADGMEIVIKKAVY